jgi:NAD(P)-dependent dehydrogenase (short-subunit alcohol dehydrogenase family)
MPKYDVNGRTVFITGAARGIGAGTADLLHAKGANVALVGLEPDRLEANAERLGDRAIWIEADVTDFEALERAVAATVDAFGRVDVAVANAGIHTVGALLTAPREQVERTLEVNLMGVWRTDKAVLPQIAENKGYILNVASLAGAAHAPLMGPYAASKAGVEGLTDSLRVELSPTGARAGCAYFGFIDTDIVRGAFEHPSTKVMEGAIPGPFRKELPVSAAAATLARAIGRRSARAWAPRWVGGALLTRGIWQPLSEKRAMRSKELRTALDLVDPANGGLDAQDPVLGVSAAVLPEEKVQA